LLEFLDERSVVRQPASIQQGVQPRDQRVAVADVRTADVQRLREPGRAAEDCEIQADEYSAVVRR